jgi:hypothetical protein
MFENVHASSFQNAFLYDLTQKIYSLVGISHKGNTVLRKDAT